MKLKEKEVIEQFGDEMLSKSTSRTTTEGTHTGLGKSHESSNIETG